MGGDKGTGHCAAIICVADHAMVTQHAKDCFCGPSSQQVQVQSCELGASLEVASLCHTKEWDTCYAIVLMLYCLA